MKLWRRFVRWLARHEIDAVREEACRAALESETNAYHAGLALGARHGQQQAYDAVNGYMQERAGLGMQAEVTAADLERARKGLLH